MVILLVMRRFVNHSNYLSHSLFLKIAEYLISLLWITPMYQISTLSCGLSLKDWTTSPSEQQIIKSFQESIPVVSIKIPDITIQARSNKLSFDALIDMSESFKCTHLNLFYLTSIIQELLYDRKSTQSIVTRLQSRPFFKIDWIGKYKVPMWGYNTIDFSKVYIDGHGKRT